MVNPLSYLVLAVKDFVAPLTKYFSSPEAMEYFFYRYGWTVSLDDDAFAQVNQLSAVKTPLEQFLAAAEALREKLDSSPEGSVGIDEFAALADPAERLFTALAAFNVSNLTSLVEPLNKPEFWSDIASHVLDDLLAQYLRIYY